MAEAKSTGKTETASAAPGEKRDAADVDRDRAIGRTTGGTTPAQQDEFEKLGVNPRLDNRTGDQRPVLATAPKPQQIDGPEVGHFAAHHERFGKDAEAALAAGRPEGEVVGGKSEGPHGRGPHGVTVGDEHGQPVKPEGTAGDRNDPRNPA